MTNRPSVRPTTPLRQGRVSRGSLGALSASRARDEDAAGLAYLTPLFCELADSIQDLRSNFESLDAINEGLDSFNEAFASYLYGLKMNAYAAEFQEAPTAINFELAQCRQAAAAAQQALHSLERRSPSPEPSYSGGHNAASLQDTTFDTNAGDNIPGLLRGGRGRARVVSARGRGVKTGAHKKKNGLLNFSKAVIETLPIKYREQQPHRQEMEQVIFALRQNPDGLYIADIVKNSSPMVPSHRVNEACLALVRSKHAIKIPHKGLLFKLDPLKHPPMTPVDA